VRPRRLAEGWYAVAFARELSSAPLRRRVLGEDVCVFRGRGGGAIVLGHESCERHGIVLAWFGGRAPRWELAPLDEGARWSKPATRLWRIKTHPQEIIENTVDVAHFASVHRYGAVEVTRPMEARGPHLAMSYAVRRGPMPMHLDILASGVGYSRVEIDLIGRRLRTVVMPTPIDDTITEVRGVTQIAMRGLPGAAIAELAALAMSHDFAADIPIWESKRYQDPPRVCAADGPIGAYRTWARQFTEAA
jgi:hypothetical protein